MNIEKIFFRRDERNNYNSMADRIIPYIFRIITYFILTGFLIIFLKIFLEGGNTISGSFLTEPPRNGFSSGGIGPALFGTASIILLMLIVAVPVGVSAAIYLNEYAKETVRKRIIIHSIYNLAGVPSVVLGLFGVGFFILVIGRFADDVLGTGLLFGKPAMLWAGITLAILILPTIIVTSLEALKAVPNSQRLTAYSLGATKWDVVKRVVIPEAGSGIITGIILAISRGAGETAPVLFLGCAFFMPELPVTYVNMGFFSIPVINPMEQFMYLSYHIFVLTTQSFSDASTIPAQNGAALVLIALIGMFNAVAFYFRYKFRKKLEPLKIREV